MARRRRNHGHSVAAGELAARAVAKIVPSDRLQLTRVRAIWPQIASGGLREVAWPVALRDGRLSIHVENNQWLHELSYMREDLLRRVQQRCPDAGVTDVRIRVGPVHVPVEPRPDPEPTPPPALPDEPSRDTIDALTDVEDADLRQAIANARLALSRRVRGS